MKLKLKEFHREVGLKLKKLREALGYDQHQMARYFGIGISGYRKNETGGALPGPNSLFRLVSEHKSARFVGRRAFIPSCAFPGWPIPEEAR